MARLGIGLTTLLGLAALACASDTRISAQTAGAGTATERATDTRRLWADPASLEGTPSPDGRYFSFTHWDPERPQLAVRDVAAGTMHIVPARLPGDADDAWPYNSAFSTDGRLLAYSWYTSEAGGLREQIRIAPLDSSAPPRVIFRHADRGILWVHGWTPDGRFVLAHIGHEDLTGELALIPADGGPPRILKRLDWRVPSTARVSPDGRHIAYDLAADPADGRRDVHVARIDGTGDRTVVGDAADDALAGWSGDGTRLLFVSDRGGTSGLWSAPVRDGAADGTPSLVRGDLARATPIGVTRDDRVFYAVNVGTQALYSASVDLASGQLRSPASLVTGRLGDAVGLTTHWSPDGRYLAYRVSAYQGANATPIIGIRSMESGEVRQLPARMASVNYLAWHPDGRALVLTGQDTRGQFGVFRLELESGAVTPLVTGRGISRMPVLAPDGRRIYFIATDGVGGNSNATAIVARDLASGAERELAPARIPNGVTALAVSPDGQQLVWAWNDPAAKASGLSAVPTDGGESRELLRLQVPENLDWQRAFQFTPDGRGIVHGRTAADRTGCCFLWVRESSLWHLPLDGGAAREIALPSRDFRRLRLSPDGRSVVYVSGNAGQELWMLDGI